MIGRVQLSDDVAKKSADPASRLRGLAWWAMWISGLLLLVVGVRMVSNHASNRAEVLLLPAELIEARQALSASPRDENLKSQIRTLDLELRRRYFRHLDSNALGGWLLLLAGVVFVISMHGTRRRQPWLPRPQAPGESPPDPMRSARDGRWAVAGAGAVAVVVLMAMGTADDSRLASGAAGGLTAAGPAAMAGPGKVTVADVAATAEEWNANWPMFRGPRGDGVAGTTNAPLDWDAESGRGIVWRSPVPSPGHNSPIVWGDRVFLTGGTAVSRHVLCYRAHDGALLWDQAVPSPPGGFGETPDIPEMTGFAASTAATDGRRVYAIFGTGELVAFDFGGSLVWSKPLGVPENMYGHATSLVVWKDLLLVQYDQGDGEDGKSKLYALETATGAVRWERSRAMPASWGTPVVMEVAGQPQVMTLGDPWVISYQADTGEEVWRLDCLGTDLAPMPVTAGGLLIVTSPNNHVSGLKMDGQGDVTETHQVWEYDEYIPDITSPVSDGERVYLLITYGDLVCLDGATGKGIWDESLDLEFNASPTLVGNRLYLVSTEGVTVVAEAGAAYRELARSQLNEPVYASPAFVDDRIFIRGMTNLFCLGSNPPASVEAP